MLSRNTVCLRDVEVQNISNSPTCLVSCSADRRQLVEVFIPKGEVRAAEQSAPLAAGHPQAELWLYCAVNGQDGTEKWFGISSWEQRQFFLQLMEADKVGATTAFSVLNANEWKTIKTVLEANDQDGFRKLKSVGPKTADKLIPIIFKDRNKSAKRTASAREEVVGALVTLGYKKPDATIAVLKAQDICGLDAASELLIKTALSRK